MKNYTKIKQNEIIFYVNSDIDTSKMMNSELYHISDYIIDTTKNEIIKNRNGLTVEDLLDQHLR